MNRRLPSSSSPPLLVLFVLTALAPAQTQLTREQVEAVVQRAHERFAPTGLAVAVVQDGAVLAEVAVGERASGAAMTPATLCNIASCSKAFTAAAIALLVEEGKLGWDDKVIDRLPEFRLQDPWITANMTVRDLLSHRCGLVTFQGDLLWYGTDYDDAEVVRRMARLPIRQRFREQFGYQNLMYLVAGLVVERTSGLGWEDFVEQRLLTPLGMHASRTSAQRLPADAEKALPHIDGEPVPDHEFVACKPAASIYASADELTHWIRMLLDDGRWQDRQVLAHTSLQAMWRPHTLMHPAGTAAGVEDFRSYGLGWFVNLERGAKIVEHDGGMPGFLSKVSLIPAERFGFVALNNANDGVLNEAIKRALLAMRAGKDGLEVVERLAKAKQRIDGNHAQERAQREAQRRDGTHPSRDLTDYCGRFIDEVYGPAEVTLVDGNLTIALLPSRPRMSGELRHWHDDTFRVDWPDRFLPFALVRFDLDTAGKVAGFGIDCPIADFDFGALTFRRAP